MTYNEYTKLKAEVSEFLHSKGFKTPINITNHGEEWYGVDCIVSFHAPISPDDTEIILRLNMKDYGYIDFETLKQELNDRTTT